MSAFGIIDGCISLIGGAIWGYICHKVSSTSNPIKHIKEFAYAGSFCQQKYFISYY